MSYKVNRNVTMIDELPYLEDLESQINSNSSNGLSMIPSENMGSIQKLIRNNIYNPPVESGMNANTSSLKQVQQPPPTTTVPPNQIIDDPRNYNQEMILLPPRHQQQYIQQPPVVYNSEPTCIQVAEHTMNCVVCSKLYQHNNSGYIVMIILLAIICILLLKRVLNV